MPIIVTGASGQFGRQTAELLAERLPPSELILVTRDPDRLSAFAARGADVRRGDFDDPEGLAEAFAGGETRII